MTTFKIEPAYRLTAGDKELGMFSDSELVALRTQIDRLLGLERLFGSYRFEVEQFLEAFCCVSGVTRIALRGRTKTEPLVFYRQMAMAMAIELCPGADKEGIAWKFNHDPATVRHNEKAVADRLDTSPKHLALYQKVRAGVIDLLQSAAPAIEQLERKDNIVSL